MATVCVAHAQGAGVRSPSVIVAVTDTLNTSDAKAILVRSSEKPEDIVILKRLAATPETLGAALALMDRLRADSPVPFQMQVATMQGGAPHQPLAGAELARLNRTLEHLAQRPTVNIGNLGLGQWVRIADTKSAP
jgi:hypothetical protein